MAVCELHELRRPAGILLDWEDRRGGQGDSIRGDADDPLSRGFVCPKGPALQALHEELGVATILGIGNAGFGMPDQTRIDLAYLLADSDEGREYLAEMEAATAACLSCHDSKAAASHALSNSSDIGEACAACHGTGKTYDVEKVHAR